MLTDDEVTAMRSTTSSALPDTCTIRRPTSASDSMGGQTITWADHATGVPVRVSPVALVAGEQLVGDRLSGRKVWLLTFGHDQDVALTDRIVFDGRTFEVVAIDGERSWQLSLRVHCVEVL